MTTPTRSPFDTPPRRRMPRWLVRGVGVLAVAALGWLVWQWASDQSGVRREAPKVSTIVPLPPPPPPPEKPPEPEKVEDKVAEEEPKPMEPVKPKIEAPPKPADPAQAMTMDAAGEAGGDAFNIGAGSGGGMAGSGGGSAGTATYGQYLAYALQQVLQNDERTRRLVFRLALNIWLDPSGRLTRVDLVESSGSPQTDAAVLAALRAAGRVDEKPTAELTFPARVVITGRRPS